MHLLADMVKLFLCKVFPHIHEEILNRSMIPTGLAGSIILGLLPESLFISLSFKVLIPESKRKIERAKCINAFSNPQ
jgi:hypothetical protein